MKGLFVFFQIICLFSIISVSLSEVPSQQSSVNWVEMLTNTDDSTQQKAKQQLLNIIWQNTIHPLVKKLEDESNYFHAERFKTDDVFLSDIDGNRSKEIIASITVPQWGQGEGIGYVIIMDENLSVTQVIKVGMNPVIIITNLLGEGKPAIIIKSGKSGWFGWNGIRIYQWEQEKLHEIWSGITSESVGIDRYSGAIRTRIQIVDLDRDGIREIVRIGEGYLNEPVGPPYEDQELIQPKIEMELGSIMNVTTEEYPNEISISPDIDFDEIEYKLAYKFREVFFWNKHFKHYIKYIARITEDTTTYIGSEAIPITDF